MFELFSNKQRSKDKASTARPEKGKPKKGMPKGGSLDHVPKKAQVESFARNARLTTGPIKPIT
jgi:hypothetical protein